MLVGAVAAVVAGPPSADAESVVPTSIGVELPGDGNSQGVALAGNIAVVGSKTVVFEGERFSEVGRTEIFQNGPNGWSKVARFEPLPTDESRYLYGRAVAVSASQGKLTAAVGGGREVYVYVSETGTSWSLQQRIPAPPDAEKEFEKEGASQIGRQDFAARIGTVALSANTLVIGNPQEPHDGIAEVGAAWVYTRSGSTWEEQQELSNPRGSLEHSEFGGSVAISQDQAIIGSQAGAYIFQRAEGKWSPEETLANPEPSNGEFGRSVAIEGNVAVVGDDFTLNPPTGNGDAFVFVRAEATSSWKEQTQLLPAGFADERGLFGRVLAISGNRLVVGSAGRAYVFTNSAGTWTPAEELADPSELATFGESVGISGIDEIVGTPNEAQNARVYGPGGALLKPELGRCVRKALGKFATANCVTPAEGAGGYEWLRGPGLRPGFSGKSTLPRLETVSHRIVQCTAGDFVGKWTGSATASVALVFTGCSALIGGKAEQCQTNPADAAQIRSEPLQAELGFIANKQGSTPKVGLALRLPNGSSTSALTFTCGSAPPLGEVWTVEGSAIGAIRPVDAMKPIFRPLYLALAGRQIPERFEAGPKETLLASRIEPGFGRADDQAGLTMPGAKTKYFESVDEERLEIKVKA